MSEYKSYLLRQLGIKESQFKPVDVDPETIDPKELEAGMDTETEHTEAPDIAKKIALHHLGEDPQYYSRMKACGLKEYSPFQSLMSPTAKSPSVLAIGIRGTPGGMMPTSMSPSDTAVAPEGVGVNPKSRAALGGLELVSRQTPNSTLVDRTPKNQTLNSSAPIADVVPPSEDNQHPAQVQALKTSGPRGIPVQALLGTTDDGNAPMGEKPEPEEFENNCSPTDSNSCDIEVPNGADEENGDNLEDEEEESDNMAPTSVDETFARHKKLMREKLHVGECKPCGCNKPNTEHPKKTKKFTTEQLHSIKKRFSKKRSLNEQEKKVLDKIDSTLKSREK